MGPGANGSCLALHCLLEPTRPPHLAPAQAKEVALEAEVTTGELKAGRVRALEAAAKALSSVAGLEREAKENR